MRTRNSVSSAPLGRGVERSRLPGRLSRLLPSLGLLSLALTDPLALRGDDWPQWMGPRRDAVWRESGVLDRFPPSGPKVLWRAPVGSGYTGPAVAHGRVYVMDRQTSPDNVDQERVLCLSEADGQVLWRQSYPCAFKISYPAGPRATPTVEDGRVFTLGAVGQLACWDAASGRQVWAHDLPREYGAKTPVWGFAAHPLVDGDKLICLVGAPDRCVIAFDKRTGRKIWHALNANEPGYSPPTLVTVGGRRQLVVWHPQAVNALDPESGRLLWSQPFTSKAGLSVAAPQLAGDLLFVSTFYNGSLLLRLAADEPKASVVWQGRGEDEVRTENLHCIISSPFLDEGHIYGLCSYGQLRCLKLETGERVWETFQAATGQSTRWGTAFLVKHQDRFFLWNERGDLIIARLSPAGYEEWSRAHLLEPTNRDAGRRVVWSPPAFANRCLFVRNDQELIRVSLAAPVHDDSIRPTRGRPPSLFPALDMADPPLLGRPDRSLLPSRSLSRSPGAPDQRGGSEPHPHRPVLHRRCPRDPRVGP